MLPRWCSQLTLNFVWNLTPPWRHYQVPLVIHKAVCLVPDNMRSRGVCYSITKACGTGGRVGGMKGSREEKGPIFLIAWRKCEVRVQGNGDYTCPLYYAAQKTQTWLNGKRKQWWGVIRDRLQALLHWREWDHWPQCMTLISRRWCNDGGLAASPWLWSIRGR